MKLSEVVNRINGNVDRFTTDLKYYIGGEHIESNELAITKRGILKENLGKLGFKFHFAFQERDVLFMARNPHLRKAGMVMFSGLCSDATYILRSKDETILTQEFLAAQLQSDHFWDYCERTKVGSVNFANNWKSIAEYEFELPSITEQHVIADKLWAAYRLKESYKKLFKATDEMVKSKLNREEKEKPMKGILQNHGLRAYLREHERIDIEWLEKVFDATRILASYKADDYLKDSWCSSEELKMIDYVPLLGCIYYLIQHPCANDLEVKRLGMHLNNICFYETNSKNPDSTVILSLIALRDLYYRKSKRDITCNSTFTDKRFWSASDQRKAKLYQTSERDNWERLFWNMQKYDNSKFNSFIKGNAAILLDLCDGNDGTDDTISPVVVQKTFENFYEKVYNQRKNKDLRLKMLECGDIRRYDNGGSWLLKDKWLKRYNLISTDDDWYDLLSDRGSLAFAAIKNFLNGTIVPTTGILSVLKDPQYGCIEYMNQLKFLWNETKPLPHMILLAQHQASVSTSRELAVQMLHKRIKDSWVWESNTCVVEFYFENGKLKVGGNNNFFFDIVYQHNEGSPYWDLYVGHRGGKLKKSMVENLKNATKHDWKFRSDDGRCYVERFSALPNPSSFTDVVETVINDFKKITSKIDKSTFD